VIGVREWGVERGPGDAHLAEFVQRTGVGFGALDCDGDVAVATCGPCGVLKLADPRTELLAGHTGVWHPFVAAGEDAADDAFAGAPAIVQNGRLDILAANQLGRALYSELFRDPTQPHNHARFNFLNPAAHDVYPDWERGANDAVALLRAEADRDPYDRDLTDLIGELSTRSEEFRTRWATHNVRLHQTGAKRFHHPVVGELTLTFEMMELAADPGLHLLTFTAEPGSKSDEALNLLGSWAATVEQEQTAPTPGEA
jgi:hypothetical protein